MKKSISNLFDSKKINATESICGGLAGSKNHPTDTDTGVTSNNTYDKETTPNGGGCDTSNTGWVGENGEKDNPNTEKVSGGRFSLVSYEMMEMRVRL